MTVFRPALVLLLTLQLVPAAASPCESSLSGRWRAWREQSRLRGRLKDLARAARLKRGAVSDTDETYYRLARHLNDLGPDPLTWMSRRLPRQKIIRELFKDVRADVAKGDVKLIWDERGLGLAARDASTIPVDLAVITRKPDEIGRTLFHLKRSLVSENFRVQPEPGMSFEEFFQRVRPILAGDVVRMALIDWRMVSGDEPAIALFDGQLAKALRASRADGRSFEELRLHVLSMMREPDASLVRTYAFRYAPIEAHELARAAGESEAAVRAFVGNSPVFRVIRTADLRFDYVAWLEAACSPRLTTERKSWLRTAVFGQGETPDQESVAFELSRRAARERIEAVRRRQDSGDWAISDRPDVDQRAVADHTNPDGRD